MEKQKKLLNKVFITLIILFISRVGIFIPIPGINQNEFNESIGQNTIINFLNIFSGGGFSTIGIFSLGIIPYINSSIIVQLLVKFIPSLEEIQKNEGESGRQKINQLIRYLTILWAIVQSTSIGLWIKPYTFNWNINFCIDLVITLTTGSIIIIWFAEVITEYGIGNGTSLLIFQNIISNIPKNIHIYSITNDKQLIITTLLILSCITILVMNILIQDSKRKIKIIASRYLGENNKLNTQNYIPLKLNQGGVMPIVFASATITIPQYIMINIQNKGLQTIFNTIISNSFIYLIMYSALILIFSYFYSSIVLNTQDISENLQKLGASIPNIRPGEETIQYLNNIINRLTFIGALFLFLIAQFPLIASRITELNLLQGLGTTSLLILVGVAIETAKQIQTYIISEQYDNIMG